MKSEKWLGAVVECWGNSPSLRRARRFLSNIQKSLAALPTLSIDLGILIPSE